MSAELYYGLIFHFFLPILLYCLVNKVQDIYIVNKHYIIMIIQTFKNCFAFLYARYYL